MPKTRALRCSQETYSMIAILAGRNGLTLCEALDQVVQESGLASALMTAGEPTITEPVAAQTETENQTAEFWRLLGQAVYDTETGELRTKSAAQE